MLGVRAHRTASELAAELELAAEQLAQEPAVRIGRGHDASRAFWGWAYASLTSVPIFDLTSAANPLVSIAPRPSRLACFCMWPPSYSKAPLACYV